MLHVFSSPVSPTTVTTPPNLIKDYKYFDQLIDITLNIFYFNFFCYNFKYIQICNLLRPFKMP